MTDFFLQHPEQCLLAKLDRIVGDPSAFVASAQKKLQLDLGKVPFKDVYDAPLLKSHRNIDLSVRLFHYMFLKPFHRLEKTLDILADI